MAATYEVGDILLIKKAFNTYRTNDILYFEYPVKDSTGLKIFFFQRLIGLPGDSLILQNKKLSMNGIQLQDISTLKNNYFIVTKDQKLDSLFKLKYNLTEGGQVSNKFDYSYSLTKLESEVLRRDSSIIKVELKSEKPNSFDETCFPFSTYYPWNLDYYGKIYVPKENDTLRLDSNSISLYATLIQDYERNNLVVKHDSILINGTLSTYYVVKKNYFFVLGDNRDNANDSRIWGFLPENCIIGKELCRIKRAKK